MTLLDQPVRLNLHPGVSGLIAGRIIEDCALVTLFPTKADLVAQAT